LEAWLEVDGEDRPWIYSNPVYLQTPTLADLSMNLPSYEATPTVDVKRDIAYIEGKPEDAAKHKLDLYVPQDKKSAPVFLFLHGGAWRSGDRSLYFPLGNRFAKTGLLTVIPSYRLAPKNPHPAQIEDAAAAFAWTVQHIAAYGGDTNRIYVGGHSAGGHLSALLALDEKYLKAHNLSPKSIRGVIAMSGVYNLAIGDVQSSVFGKDRQARVDASPIFHVHNSAPPFLITYCEWDYPTLPAQAKLFHAALRKAGVKSELAFTPKQSHISEMIAVTRDDDVTAKAVLGFIR
jgi:acetyl esterase/lipase